jgi:hypothetical protein
MYCILLWLQVAWPAWTSHVCTQHNESYHWENFVLFWTVLRDRSDGVWGNWKNNSSMVTCVKCIVHRINNSSMVTCVKCIVHRINNSSMVTCVKCIVHRINMAWHSKSCCERQWLLKRCLKKAYQLWRNLCNKSLLQILLNSNFLSHAPPGKKETQTSSKSDPDETRG